MPKVTSIDEATILAAALEGLKLQRRTLDEQIQEVKAKLDKRGGRKSTGGGAKPRKRVLSAAARKRIAQAQKKRWAEYRKQTAAQG